jgi:hypothetical protein
MTKLSIINMQNVFFTHPKIKKNRYKRMPINSKIKKLAKNFITFDRLSFNIPPSIIKVTNKKEFEYRVTEKDGCTSASYMKKVPYNLAIKLFSSRNDVPVYMSQPHATVDFTGKILGDDYLVHINKKTFKNAIDTINGLGVCKIDTYHLLEVATINLVDVVKDVDVSDYDGNIIDDIAYYIDRGKYNVSEYNGGIVVENKLSTPGLKMRLTIYNKGKESKLARNKQFCQILTKKTINKLSNLIRFELNVKTHAGIRNALKVNDVTLKSVLSSKANPILDILKNVLVPYSNSNITKRCKQDALYDKFCTTLDYKQYKNALALKAVNCSIADLKYGYESCKNGSNNTRISQLLKPYKAVLTDYEEYKSKYNGEVKSKYKKLIEYIGKHINGNETEEVEKSWYHSEDEISSEIPSHLLIFKEAAKFFENKWTYQIRNPTYFFCKKRATNYAKYSNLLTSNNIDRTCLFNNMSMLI